MVRPVLLCGVYFPPAILHIYCFYNKSMFQCYSGFLNLPIKIHQICFKYSNYKCMLYKSHIFITISNTFLYNFIFYKLTFLSRKLTLSPYLAFRKLPKINLYLSSVRIISIFTPSLYSNSTSYISLADYKYHIS